MVAGCYVTHAATVADTSHLITSVTPRGKRTSAVTVGWT